MTDKYDDIINLPHHISQSHPQMSMRDRAAQFSPFAALVGYEDAIDETARLTEQRRELDEQEQAELNREIQAIMAAISERPQVCIEHFVADSQKQGGKYVCTTGTVLKISTAERLIILQDGTSVKMDDIVSIRREKTNL